MLSIPTQKLHLTLFSPRQFSNEVVSSTLTGLLTAAIVIWLFLELTLLDRYTRWTITPGFGESLGFCVSPGYCIRLLLSTPSLVSPDSCLLPSRICVS